MQILVSQSIQMMARCLLVSQSASAAAVREMAQLGAQLAVPLLEYGEWAPQPASSSTCHLNPTRALGARSAAGLPARCCPYLNPCLHCAALPPSLAALPRPDSVPPAHRAAAAAAHPLAGAGTGGGGAGAGLAGRPPAVHHRYVALPF